MKIKKIAAICNQEGLFLLYNQVDKEGVVTQWLGTQSALYPLLGAPVLDEDSLCTMLDIPEKKREKLTIRCVEMQEIISTADVVDGDYLLSAGELSICYEGIRLLPIWTRDGVIFIQEKFLEPLGDEKDFLELHCRKTPQGFPYIAAKVGMMLRGIILPYDLNVDVAGQMESIAQGHRKMMALRRTIPENPFAAGEKGREEEGGTK